MEKESLDRRLLLAGAGLAGVAALSRLTSAGPVDPPPGPVGPTGRTLQELYNRVAVGPAGIAEPRVAVQSLSGSATSLHAITEPGSYYLTGNLGGASGKNTIEIAAPDVTLDLCGFTVSTEAAVLPGYAVLCTPAASSTTLRVVNGTVGGSLSLDAPGGGVRLSLLEDLRIRGVVFADQLALRRTHVNGNSSGGAVIVRNGAVFDRSSCFSTTGADVGGSLFASDSEFTGMAGLIARGTANIRGCRIGGFGAVALAVRGSDGMIEGNSIRVAGAPGIAVTGTGNLITRNAVTGGAPAYSIGPGNSYGPIVSVAGLGDMSAIPAAQHPWANFAY